MTRLRSRLTVLVVGVLALTALSSVPTAQASPSSATTESVVRNCSQDVAPGHFACYALRRADVGFTPKSRYRPGAVGAAAPAGYSPTDLASAYNLPTTQGAGQRVYVIDAFDDPPAAADLNTYRTQYGLPACTTANGCFRKINQRGATSPLPARDANWAGETALDLDMVSAACPKCAITLIESDTDGDDLFTAVDEAVTLGAKFVSMSWGSDEFHTDPSYNTYFSRNGVVFAAASGDSGYGAGYPASSPNVVSIGGTHLVKSSNARGWTESVYNDPSDPTSVSATGSGCSAYETKPAYQSSISNTVCAKRAENDVSAVGDPRNGVAVYQSYGDGGVGWTEYGGTSAATPIIASVYALAGTPSTSISPQQLLYAHTADLNDVTSGNDGTCPAGAQHTLCTAAAGWDGPTGLGTPNGTAAFSSAGVVGDCELGTVTCRPDNPPQSSCTNYSSQTTPPTTIKVLVRTTATAVAIQTVNFKTYVENVLPNEWLASWDGDALKAGAVAVKSYAWYWATHFGGFINGDSTQCFDVTDDQDFQVYRAGSAATRTNTAVVASWPVAAREDGQIVQTLYKDNLNANHTDACGEDADGTIMSQNGTQACNEANTGNKYNVILGKYYYPGLQLSTAQQLRTQHDFQFLQKSTHVVFKSGAWSVDDGYPTSFSFGQSGDLPTVINSGDGFARVGVFRPSTATWYLGSHTGTVASKVPFGAKGDIPVQAHYNGTDQATQLAVFRPSTFTWYLATPTGGVASKTIYGAKGDIPVPGHYDGAAGNDYADQIAVFRPSNARWYVHGQASIQYGQTGDIPVPADYDGNGTTDIAIYRPSTHRFYVRGQASVQWGESGDVPVTGDFTGDGKADLAVFRPSTQAWYVKGATTRVWGSSGATPIGKAPYHD